MLTRTLLLLAALTCVAAAPPPKPAAAKPAAKPAAAAAAPRPAVAGAFDLRNPDTLVSLLRGAGATAKLGKREEDAVMVDVTSVAANFSVQFAGCDKNGRGCKALLFDSGTDAAPTFAQLNAFNQTSAACRAWQDRSGKAHIVYSSLIFADDSRDHALTHLAAWQGCLAEFHTFLQDPNAYLAEAP